MTPEQLQHYRNMLLELLTESMHKIEDIKSVIRRLSESGMQEYEKGNLEELFSQADQNLQLMGEISQALNRMNRGKFGTCMACRGGISQERLELFPTARFCDMCSQVLFQAIASESNALLCWENPFYSSEYIRQHTL